MSDAPTDDEIWAQAHKSDTCGWTRVELRWMAEDRREVGLLAGYDNAEGVYISGIDEMIETLKTLIAELRRARGMVQSSAKEADL